MDPAVREYNASMGGTQKIICTKLSKIIDAAFDENKIWHRHPVWFLEGNPIVGYSPRKDGSICLLFWSGQSFDEEKLVAEGSFKAAEIRYNSAEDVNEKDLKRWLAKSKKIQWDYKNIVRRKGLLKKL